VTWPTPVILILGAAGISLAAYFYLRQEAPVRNRGVLLGARLLVLALAILLLLDLRIPGEAPSGEGRRWILIDPDLSLVVPDPSGEGTLWEEVLRRATEESAGGARLALASPSGRGPEGTDLASLALRAPDHPPGDLVEGALRLGESGADSVVVVSTLRHPPTLLERLAEEISVPVRLERPGDRVRNAGIAELSLPETVREGEEFEGRIAIFGEGMEPADSALVTIEADGALVFQSRVPVPAAGVEVSLDLSFPPPPPGVSPVRYLARVQLDGDVFPFDDERARWISVGEEEVGILLISASPDWEPRQLLPTLRSVTGLEGEGYLALTGGRYLTLEAENTPARIVGTEDFMDRAARARILVLHGVEPGGAASVDRLAAEHPRVLVLAGGGGTVPLEGLVAGVPLSGEWTPDGELPPSPLSPFLSGLRLGGLPPLAAVLPLESGAAFTTGLAARRTPGGEALPVIVLREEPGRRQVIAVADGYWRWAARDGTPRETYRALWGGAADWLLAGGVGRTATAFQPVDVVVSRGAPLLWHLPDGVGAGELTLQRLTLGSGVTLDDAAEDGAPAYSGPVVGAADRVATTPPMEPGVYRYTAIFPGGTEEQAGGPAPGQPGGQTVGVIEVEGWAPSLRLPPLEVGDGLLPGTAGAGLAGELSGRPLRSHPLPYLLILILLCAEWVGRRRVGLR